MGNERITETLVECYLIEQARFDHPLFVHREDVNFVCELLRQGLVLVTEILSALDDFSDCVRNQCFPRSVSGSDFLQNFSRKNR